MSNPWTACGLVEGFVWPSLGLSKSKTIAYVLTTCSYFDNLKFDICDAVVLAATLARLYRVLGDFHMSTDTLMQNVLLVF